MPYASVILKSGGRKGINRGCVPLSQAEGISNEERGTLNQESERGYWSEVVNGDKEEQALSEGIKLVKKLWKQYCKHTLETLTFVLTT